MDKFKKLYRKEYFKKRDFNDKKRLTAFLQEKKFMSRHLNINGKVCDVGCSTGEFLETINWKGPRFGIEISDYARDIAKKYKIDFTKNILTEKNFLILLFLEVRFNIYQHRFIIYLNHLRLLSLVVIWFS